MKKIVFIILLLLSSTALAEDLNPKSIGQMKVKIVQSGTLEIAGNIQYANLTMYIPQENVESIDISPGSFKYVYDDYGNKMVMFEWLEDAKTPEFKQVQALLK